MKGPSRVYVVKGDDAYGGIRADEGVRTVDLLRRFAAVCLSDGWERPTLYLEDGPAGGADLTMMFHGAFAARGGAKDKLKECLGNAVEFLQADGPEPLWVVNVVRVLDALDESRSDVKRNSKGEIWRVNRYALLDLDYEMETLFKVKGRERDYIFAAESFVRHVALTNLTGLKFQEVEAGP
jgi:hypothetical protein